MIILPIKVDNSPTFITHVVCCVLTVCPFRWMFWTDWEPRGAGDRGDGERGARIERATLSGAQRVVLFDVWRLVRSAEWPNGVACDLDGSRVFWVDARSDSVHSVTYSGSDHRELFRQKAQMLHPYGLAVFGTQLFITDWKSTSLLQVSLI